jgi:3-hydroxybutyryl-CoA dehydrogenase
VEVVSESQPVKTTVYEQVDRLAGPETIIWSNTSSMNIFDLMAPSRLPRTVIAHWFAPPQILPLVEVVQGPETLPEVVELTLSFLKSLNKRPVFIKNYIPGFVINRLLRILGRETYFLLDNGYISPEDLDLAVKASIAPRMMVLGLVQRYDFTGLDLTYANLQNKDFVDAPVDNEPEFIVSRVKKNHLGVKTGIGVYDYRSRDKAEVIKDRDRYLLKVINRLQFCLEKKRLL